MVYRGTVPDLHAALIVTAGAYVLVGGAYLFAIGPNDAGPTLAVFRLGGHRAVAESAWACAAREVAEEAAVHVQPLSPPATYWVASDRGGMDVQPITWPAPDSAPVAPLLVSVHGTAGRNLSAMYLARALGRPTPSTEIRGLLFLRPHELHWIVQEPVSLGDYLGAGGDAVLHDPLDEDRLLEPFLQLRALSRILQRHENRLSAPT